MVRFELEGIDAAVGALSGALEQELVAAMHESTRVVADSAAARHEYTNRSGRLQARTVPGGVSGSFVVGIRGDVLGDTRYGGFVEFGTSRSRPYPYLRPAYDRETPRVVAIFDAALATAVSRAGWV